MQGLTGRLGGVAEEVQRGSEGGSHSRSESSSSSSRRWLDQLLVPRDLQNVLVSGSYGGL
jgi:hypothetical protein